MKKYLILSVAVLAVALCFTGCKKKKVVEPPVVEKPAPVVEKPVVKPDPVFFIVAGCFEYENRADALVQTLKGEGYADAVKLDYYENLWLVAYTGYAEESEAEAALASFKTDHPDAWIYNIKK